MEGQREDRGFPIQKLPCLVTSQIIRLMETWEQIRLCLTSKKTEMITRSVNLPPMVYRCCFKDNNSAISIGAGNPCAFLTCGSEAPEVIVENYVIKEELSKWLKPTDSNELETIMSLLEKVILFIPQSYMEIHLELAEMRTMSIQDIFSHPIIQNCEAVMITGGEEIPSEDLNCILDTASCLRRLKLTNTNPPYGYCHEKIFQIDDFESPSYEWMTIEFLFTLKNGVKTNIEKNPFSYADLNRFLKYWVHSEIDMFDDILCIKMEEDIPENVLFDGITRLNSMRFVPRSYQIKADSNHQQRSKLILCVWYEDGTLKLSSWTRDERLNDEAEAELFRQEYDALIAVERRMEMKQTLKENYDDEEIQNEIRKLNEQLEKLQEQLNFTIAE